MCIFSGRRSPLKGELREMQSGSPPFQLCMKLLNQRRIQREREGVMQEGRGFLLREAQVSSTHFNEGTSRTQAGQRERRITTRYHQEMERFWEVVEKKRERFVNQALGNHLIIFQHQHASCRGLSRGVEEDRKPPRKICGQKGRLRSQSSKCALNLRQISPKRLTGRHEIAPEAQRVILRNFQGNPGHRGKISAGKSRCYPLADQGRLSKASGSREQREGTRLSSIEERKEARAIDQKSRQAWLRQLREAAGMLPPEKREDVPPQASRLA